MAKQQLTGAKVADLLVEQRDLGTAKTVGAISGRIEPHGADPLVDQPRILAGSEMAPCFHAAGEQPIIEAQPFAFHPCCDRSARLFRNFKLDRPSRLLLDD